MYINMFWNAYEKKDYNLINFTIENPHKNVNKKILTSKYRVFSVLYFLLNTLTNESWYYLQ